MDCWIHCTHESSASGFRGATRSGHASLFAHPRTLTLPNAHTMDTRAFVRVLTSYAVNDAERTLFKTFAKSSGCVPTRNFIVYILGEALTKKHYPGPFGYYTDCNNDGNDGNDDDVDLTCNGVKDIIESMIKYHVYAHKPRRKQLASKTIGRRSETGMRLPPEDGDEPTWYSADEPGRLSTAEHDVAIQAYRDFLVSDRAERLCAVVGAYDLNTLRVRAANAMAAERKLAAQCPVSKALLDTPTPATADVPESPSTPDADDDDDEDDPVTEALARSTSPTYAPSPSKRARSD